MFVIDKGKKKQKQVSCDVSFQKHYSNPALLI